MKKTFTITLALCLLVFNCEDATAGKGYSSGGGRSYSSSSRSFSSSSSSRSFSSPSRSYSSPSRSSTFSPSRSTSSSKSYSSTNKSYTSNNKSYSSTNSTHQSTGPPSKSYSNGNKGYTSSNSRPTGTFQSLAASEQRKAESRTAYQQATAPKPTYTTPRGNTVTIKSDSSRVVQIRNMPQENWVHRETRVRNFYHNYYSLPPTVVHYNDPYSTFFWLWLLDRSLDDRAYWAYHHRYDRDMDEARYRDLLAKDRALEARIKQLENEKITRDPNYVPKGLPDKDLQYTDEFVNAAVNPQLKPYDGPTWGGFFHGLWVFIEWCFIIAVLIFVIWLIFGYEW